MGGRLRARKKEQTRRALEAAALRLFEEKGFKETSVEEIAAAAEVSPRTFFRYFGSKEDVLFPEEQAQVERLVLLLREHWDGRLTIGAVAPALVAFATDVEQRCDVMLSRTQIVEGTPSLLDRSLRARRVWTESLAGEFAAGTGRDRCDVGVRLLALLVVSLLEVTARTWRESGGTETAAEVARRALSALPEVLDLQPA